MNVIMQFVKQFVAHIGVALQCIGVLAEFPGAILEDLGLYIISLVTPEGE